MTTLKDIAEELGVSIALVSKVISGRMGTTGASEKTRKAILAKTRERNFRPNPLGVALRAGRRAAIGVFIHPQGGKGSGLTESLLAGIAETLNANDERLWLTFYKADQQFLQRCSQTSRMNVDGLLVAGIAHRELVEPILKIERSGVPVVTVVSEPLSPAIPNVYSDVAQQTYLSTCHLIDRGCKRIAHIHSLDERLKGYRQALREHQIEFDPALVYHDIQHFEVQHGVAAVRQWLEQGVTFDGIVAQSDHQAIGAIHELSRHSIKVPEAVRVTGVDNSPLCDASPVPLTSVSQEMAQAGKLAAQMLLQRVKGETVKSAIISPTLHVRASS
jgi:LacI family transcriptional regulator